MTVLWFFLVVSLNGEPTVFWGFPNEGECSAKRAVYAKNMAKVTRDVTECIGVPVKKRAP